MLAEFAKRPGFVMPEPKNTPGLGTGRVLVLSDAHLLAEFDDRRDTPRLTFYTALAEAADSVLILGDLVNKLSDYPAILKTRWRSFLYVLSTKNTHLIYGNHDNGVPPIDPFWKTHQEAVETQRWGKHIVAMHGHQFDASRHIQFMETPLGRLFQPMYDRTETWLIRSRTGSLLQFLVEKTTSRDHKELISMLDPSRELLLLGHRHRGLNLAAQGLAETGYSNSDRISWLSMDNDGLRFHAEWIRKINRTNPMTIPLAQYFESGHHQKTRPKRK